MFSNGFSKICEAKMTEKTVEDWKWNQKEKINKKCVKLIRFLQIT